MKAKLTNHETGAVKEVKVGFSWTVFFFGFFVPFIRGDFKWGIILLVISLVAGGVSMGAGAGLIDIVFAFLYNKLYVKELVSKGFEPSSSADRDVLNTKNYLS